MSNKIDGTTEKKNDGTTEMKNEGTTGKRDQLVWTNQMGDAFIQAMLKEKHNGNRLDGSFTPQAYTNMVDELKKVFKRDLKKDHLKNRLKTLKGYFSQCYDVFRGVKLSEFLWNSNTKIMEAEDEVWEALIKEKPEALKWKTKPIYHYDEMCELFAKDRATGIAAETAKERKNRLSKNEERFDTIDDLDQMLEKNEISLKNFVNVDEIQVKSPTPRVPKEKPSKKVPKGKKWKWEEEEDEFTQKIMSSIDKVAAALDRNTKVMESSRPHVYSEGEIYKELELMGMGPDDLANAYLFLVARPEKTRALFSCPLLMRMAILEKMMHED